MFKFLVLTLGIISCQAYAEDTVIVNDHDISAIKDCWQKNSDDDTDINVIKSCLRQEYNLVDAGNDSNLLIVFYVQIMPDDFVMQLHRF